LLASHPIFFVDGCIDRQGPQYATRLGNDIFLFGLVYLTYFYKYICNQVGALELEKMKMCGYLVHES
jgi:hypothetical protein